jgi:ABC-type uncharacterized transport system, periplasmic component
MKKKAITMLMAVAMMGMTMTGCSKENETKSNTQESGETKVYTIGISQFAEHGSLDNCREGFLQGLAEEGFVEGENLAVDIKNAAADMGTATQIAQNFMADKVDLICGIATPSAQSAFNVTMDMEKPIPVIYTAITDPIVAELADKSGNAVGEITGTSDKIPAEQQLAMIREILPEAKTVGIIYTTSEANSISAIEEYKEKVAEYGFTLEVVGITNTSEVSLATEALLEKVDCITNLTDNTVVSALPAILDKANEKNIPVFGSEVEQVKLGCLAAEGIDYLELGRQTGRMAAKVLRGEQQASEIPFETIEESNLYINTEVAKNLNIVLNEEMIARATETFASIAE